MFPKSWSLTLLGFGLALVLKVQSLSPLAVVATVGPSCHTGPGVPRGAVCAWKHPHSLRNWREKELASRYPVNLSCL